MPTDERRSNSRLLELIDDMITRLAVVESSISDIKKYHRILIITVCVIAAGKSIIEVLK